METEILRKKFSQLSKESIAFYCSYFVATEMGKGRNKFQRMQQQRNSISSEKDNNERSASAVNNNELSREDVKNIRVEHLKRELKAKDDKIFELEKSNCEMKAMLNGAEGTIKQLKQYLEKSVAELNSAAAKNACQSNKLSGKLDILVSALNQTRAQLDRNAGAEKLKWAMVNAHLDSLEQCNGALRAQVDDALKQRESTSSYSEDSSRTEQNHLFALALPNEGSASWSVGDQCTAPNPCNSGSAALSGQQELFPTRIEAIWPAEGTCELLFHGHGGARAIMNIGSLRSMSTTQLELTDGFRFSDTFDTEECAVADTDYCFGMPSSTENEEPAHATTMPFQIEEHFWNYF